MFSPLGSSSCCCIEVVLFVILCHGRQPATCIYNGPMQGASADEEEQEDKKNIGQENRITHEQENKGTI